jgi:uncharacterized protein (DUF1697 family)
MSPHLALLRGVNVGGNKGVPMAELRALAGALSLGNPRTLLQSGNLVFSSEGAEPAELERRLEAAIAEKLGVETEVCVRPAAVWRRVVQANPFPEAARADPAHLLLVAFKAPPRSDGPETLAAAYDGPEQLRLAEGHAYIVYPDGVGRSKLTPALLGRHLGQGTARNWNTVLKLERMLSEAD